MRLTGYMSALAEFEEKSRTVESLGIARVAGEMPDLPDLPDNRITTAENFHNGAGFPASLWGIGSKRITETEHEAFEAAWALFLCMDKYDLKIWLCGQAYLLTARPPIKQKALAAMAKGLDICRYAVPVFSYNPGKIRSMTSDIASEYLALLEFSHKEEGFKIKGWHGLDFPESWPESVKDSLMSVYCLALQKK
jgi:hypothetical protein